MQGTKQDSARIVAPPPVIYVGVFALGMLLEWIWPGKLLSSPVAFGIGAVILLCGVIGAVWAILTLRRARTAVNPYKPTTAIVTDGPYRFSRNPIYVSDAVIYAGLALGLNAIWPLVLLPVVVWIMQSGVISQEEQYLERKFGEEYLRYKRSVHRWI